MQYYISLSATNQENPLKSKKFKTRPRNERNTLRRIVPYPYTRYLSSRLEFSLSIPQSNFSHRHSFDTNFFSFKNSLIDTFVETVCCRSRKYRPDFWLTWCFATFDGPFFRSRFSSLSEDVGDRNYISSVPCVTPLTLGRNWISVFDVRLPGSWKCTVPTIPLLSNTSTVSIEFGEWLSLNFVTEMRIWN